MKLLKGRRCIGLQQDVVLNPPPPYLHVNAIPAEQIGRNGILSVIDLKQRLQRVFPD